MLISTFDHFHFHPTLELKSRFILRSCHMWMQKSFCSDLNDAKNGIAEPQVSVKLFYNRNNNRQKSVKKQQTIIRLRQKEVFSYKKIAPCPARAALWCPLVTNSDKSSFLPPSPMHNCTIAQLHNCTITQLYIAHCTMHNAHCHSKQVQLSLQRYNM